ncbi:MAG: sugar ABC transporter substrate-binding protein [Aggregatilineales bacterium]
MKKQLFLALLIILLSLSISMVSAQDDVVELEFVNWIGSEEATAEDLEAMLAAFEEANPDIRVNNVPLPFPESGNQLLVRSLGGNPPDISMTHTAWVGPLIEAGVLMDLTDVILNQDDYFPFALESGIVDGKLNYVTWAPSPTIVYYNINLLADAGYDSPPETWAEMMEMSEAVAALNDDTYGFVMETASAANAGFYFLGNIMSYYGADLFDEDGNVALDSPETVEAYTFAMDLFDRGISPTGNVLRNTRELFSQNHAAFYRDGEYGVGIIEALNPEMVFGEDFGVILLPGDEAGVPTPTFYIEHQLAIYEGTEHVEEAARLIDFLTGPEGIAIYNDFGGFKLPVRESSANIDFYSAPENAFMGTFIEAMDTANALPGEQPTFGALMITLAEGLQRVGIIGEDPATVVPELAEEVIDILDE